MTRPAGRFVGSGRDGSLSGSRVASAKSQVGTTSTDVPAAMTNSCLSTNRCPPLEACDDIDPATGAFGLCPVALRSGLGLSPG